MPALTFSEIIAKWEARLSACRELGASVDGERLCQLALSDLRSVHDARGDESLSLQEAAAESGYHADSLSRMMREGRLQNIGSTRRPLLRRSDLPKRTPRTNERALVLGNGVGAPSASHIAREAVASRIPRT